ncbi:HNH endonuclease [Massilia sp. TWP1-3-3]|uniref:HNH endonuclease n=1 Tax=Massilia sp. TWP1-3-3 TaxID=2804573 RepID=UPI003CFA6DC2
MRITMRQVEASYDVASQVFDKKIPSEAGALLLQDTHGLNINTARDFINDFRMMLHGKVFHRAMSAPAIEYYLTRIRSERGSSSQDKAIAAVRMHIDYYEGLRTVNLNAMRAVVERHSANQSAPPPLAAQEAAFNAAVNKAIADSPANRDARLLEAARMPVKMRVVTEVYVRNPDVVAAALDRAKGVCERCCTAAPFMRKKDGTPYLEVHHRKQLAHGGEDTVENANALCANCHRELHYGVDTTSVI